MQRDYSYFWWWRVRWLCCVRNMLIVVPIHCSCIRELTWWLIVVCSSFSGLPRCWLVVRSSSKEDLRTYMLLILGTYRCSAGVYGSIPLGGFPRIIVYRPIGSIQTSVLKGSWWILILKHDIVPRICIHLLLFLEVTQDWVEHRVNQVFFARCRDRLIRHVQWSKS